MPAVTEGASTISSTISLVKTIIGAGLLSMPLAFSTDGIIFGAVIILVAAATSGYGLFLQGYVSRYVPAGHASFFNVCSITYPSLSVVFDVAIAVQCFGCAISYLVLVGDLMPTIVTHVSFVSKEHYRTFWIVALAVLCVPLSFLKNLDSLKYTSIMALVAIGYMAVLVVGHFLAEDVPKELKGNLVLVPPTISGVFSTFSIIVFAYTGHQNMFSIINESKDRSLTNLTSLMNTAIAISLALFIVVGLAGYLTFGDLVDGNVILLYPAAWTTTVGRFCIVFMVIFSFPLMLHPARISVNNIYYWIRINYFCQPEEDHHSQTSSEETALLQEQQENADLVVPKASQGHIVPFSNPAFYTITVILLVVGYTAAATIQSFALVLAVVGATGSTAISFILPGLFGYKLIGSESDDPSALENILKTLSLILVIWGFAVMVLCLYTSLFM